MQETQETIPRIGKVPWRRKWQPPPVFLPEESHGQGSLAGYSPWGHKELDMTEHTAQHKLAHWYLLPFSIVPSLGSILKKKKGVCQFHTMTSFWNKIVFFFSPFILDWESQFTPKEPTPLQDISEENSSYDFQMVRFLGDDSSFPVIGEGEE